MLVQQNDLPRIIHGAVFPRHPRHGPAIAFTTEGAWPYEEGTLPKNSMAYEPVTEVAPAMGKLLATITPEQAAERDVEAAQCAAL